MTNLFNFYNTLFAIEVAVFGIISAVILVFIQLVYSNFSYRQIGQILRNKYLILYFVFSTIDLVLTSAGSYFLSFGYHDLIPNYFFSTDYIISNTYFVLTCLLLIFVSLAFFVILIIKNISYLQPYRALFLLIKNIDYMKIRDFLYKKYGLDVPPNFKIIFFRDNKPVEEETEEEKNERLIKEEKEEEEKHEAQLELAKKIKKMVENKEDPLLPVLEMGIQFIKKSDLKSLEETKSLLVEISKDFINQLPSQKNEDWFPEKDLGIKYVKYLISIFNTLLEISEKEKLESAEKIILDTSFEVAVLFLEVKAYYELDKICEFWQKHGDKKIGFSSYIFQLVMNYFLKVGDKLFDELDGKLPTEGNNEEDQLENIFRYVAWLGERLLIKVPLEKLPIIRVFDYNTEYSELYNCLMSFSYRYNREQAGRYPLIYFDALYVLLDKLIEIFKKDKDYDIGNNIFSICYAFASFAEDAIRVKNSRGTALAVMRINEAYGKLKREGLDEQAKDCMELMVRVGMFASAERDNLERVEFMDSQIFQYAMDAIVESGENVANEVHESYIKLMGGDHEKRWEFITQLGMKLGTNFGFMFDEVTGDTYTNDDPRRR